MILPRTLDSSPLFGDLNTASGTENALDVTVNGELTGGDRANHEETGTNTTVRATDTKLLSDLDQTGDGTLTRSTLGLVDLGEHGVGRLGDDGGGETSDETGAEVDTGLGTIGESVLVDGGKDGLGDLLEDDELGHGVGNPMESAVSGNLAECNLV